METVTQKEVQVSHITDTAHISVTFKIFCVAILSKNRYIWLLLYNILWLKLYNKFPFVNIS